MNNKREKFARFGIAARGVVYCLIGILAAMAAFGGGGKKSGSGGILEWISKQTFGQILLGLLALGLIGFVFWRMYQSFGDADNEGDDKQGIGKRIAYFFSGLLYGFLAFNAIQILIGSASGGGSGGGKQSALSWLMSKPAGQILVAVIATGVLAKAIYDMYKAYSGKFREKMEETDMDEKTQTLMVNAGKVGFTARGIIFGVIAFLVYKAALTSSSGQAGGTKKAFDFLQDTFGTVVFGVIALGLLCFGIVMLIMARHREMDVG